MEQQGLNMFFFLGGAGIVFGGVWLFMWLPELLKEKSFFKNAILTQGQVMSKVGAKQGSNTEYGVDTTGAMPGGATYKGAVNTGKFIIRVEFETNEGLVYEVKSKHALSEPIPNPITIHYNPDHPGREFAIEGYYQDHIYLYLNLGVAIVLFVAGIISILFASL